MSSRWSITCGVTRNADLVDCLRELPRTSRPHQELLSRVAIEQSDDSCISLRRSADHDRQRAILRTRLATRDRRVETLDALCAADVEELPRELRGAGGVIHE